VIDFLLGFGGVDLANDDSATTAPLRLLNSERELLQDLARIQGSDEQLAAYRNRDTSGPSLR